MSYLCSENSSKIEAIIWKPTNKAIFCTTGLSNALILYYVVFIQREPSAIKYQFERQGEAQKVGSDYESHCSHTNTINATTIKSASRYLACLHGTLFDLVLIVTISS